MWNRLCRTIGRLLVHHLEKPARNYVPFAVSDPETLGRVLEPGDIVLVEGNERISVAIKYLTQSTWSHAAVYVGDAAECEGGQCLIEANLSEGVVAVPLAKYKGHNTRICRAVGLSDSDRRAVVEALVAGLGTAYDLRNVIDLARYLLPKPPVPVRWRRGLLALGSGDPSRAICSTLIAQAFQSVHYPILPRREHEVLHLRHHSLFVPRDFDLSPYFQVVKPTLETGFDYRSLTWGDSGAEED
ncbi:MAG TPA: YiiX/YebB-like N1pC/P60 family cysteine hydrolase [Alphaproteobacteria bacterium]|jgi:hypothetical protein|nr:YiiX/YebB-like N1pC/P60 family cysteine hydrolase [Alphaproteobacteria bacterium]MDP7427963.1 YiiX/YebB-like N1pC/P60 family cysteine hydrolase [Alphaproteobacteria bacterium]HJM49483.1 YiiX/YebB-like N1pC/P60 family cysteine hydrolase [Alphaproteobacteria bacterium]